jgi:hypothetical protein
MVDVSKWKEGDLVKVKSRPVTEEDRKKNRYFEHMAGLVGNVQNVYSEHEIAVQVDPSCLGPVTASVHATAVQRMRDRFLDDMSEVQKKLFTKEELEFDTHYVLLVQGSDLEQP